MRVEFPKAADEALLAEIHRVVSAVVADGGAVGWLEPPSRPDCDEWVAELFAGGARFVIVREDDGPDGPGPVQALGEWHRLESPVLAHNGEIRRVMVHPDARGRGLGRAVVAALLADATAAGIESLVLEVRGNNHAAIRLYESFGFREYGRLPDSIAVGPHRFDQVRMWRVLNRPATAVRHGSHSAGPGAAPAAQPARERTLQARRPEQDPLADPPATRTLPPGEDEAVVVQVRHAESNGALARVPTPTLPAMTDNGQAVRARPAPVLPVSVGEGSVGTRLRAARESLGWTIDELSQRTWIRPGVIEALEADDFSRCGGPVYARGHIRSLARVMQLDEEPLLAELEGEQSATAPTALASPEPTREVALRPARRVRSTEPRGPRWPLAMVAVLVVVCIIALVQLLLPSSSDKKGSSPRPSASAPAAPAPSAAAPAQPSTNPAAIPPSGVTLRLQLERGPSWVQAFDTSGRVLAAQTFPQSTSPVDLHSDQGLRVVFGNAGAVTASCNGHDLGSLGGQGQVVTLRFDRGDPNCPS